jgi:hypothetical protein
MPFALQLSTQLKGPVPGLRAASEKAADASVAPITGGKRAESAGRM